MSENNPNDEMIEIDGDHPWIQAALAMEPLPQPSSAKIEPVDLPAPTEEEPERMRRAAMMTVVTGAGVMTAFLSPGSMAQLMEQAAAIFDYWNESETKQGPQLIVADKNMEAQAKALHNAAQEMRKS